MTGNESPHCNELLADIDGRYLTESHPAGWFSTRFPTFTFYRQFLGNVFRSSAVARRGQYDSLRWSQTSFEVLRSLESVGVRFEISGLEHLANLTTPCVLVGNHMSMLETIVLPAIIQPVCDVTFVVKQSLMDYPVFRHILRARDPIAVSRDNPREDLKQVMSMGAERLGKGISIVVFPQTTRSETFDPEAFNTIGVKLAARTKVPVLPIALKTDAWGNGTWIKDLGPIRPDKKVRFEFGEPMEIEGRGSQQQQAIVNFIASRLDQWKDVDRESGGEGKDELVKR
ncbi:lysophospholipid acyltransferase family protein [Rhodopirellula sp. JC639]|uniref:lysophospholipid acyltransferase family protein n=1 Tax=Stieleria mannarensis TaxID=2755585 RepID=UPI0015FFFF49|nr:lysophospholipid acyltransferase family protein [Rhodopirellula sp. JC639]